MSRQNNNKNRYDRVEMKLNIDKYSLQNILLNVKFNLLTITVI